MLGGSQKNSSNRGIPLGKKRETTFKGKKSRNKKTRIKGKFCKGPPDIGAGGNKGGAGKMGDKTWEAVGRLGQLCQDQTPRWSKQYSGTAGKGLVTIPERVGDEGVEGVDCRGVGEPSEMGMMFQTQTPTTIAEKELPRRGESKEGS